VIRPLWQDFPGIFCDISAFRTAMPAKMVSAIVKVNSDTEDTHLLLRVPNDPEGLAELYERRCDRIFRFGVRNSRPAALHLARLELEIRCVRLIATTPEKKNYKSPNKRDARNRCLIKELCLARNVRTKKTKKGLDIWRRLLYYCRLYAGQPFVGFSGSVAAVYAAFSKR